MTEQFRKQNFFTSFSSLTIALIVSALIISTAGSSNANADVPQQPLPSFAKTPATALAAAVGVPQDASTDRIESLTKQILQCELAIQKLNTEFRLETALTSRWRQRRVFLYGEANANCTEVSMIEGISARRQLLRSREKSTGSASAAPVQTDDEPDISADELPLHSSSTSGSGASGSGSSAASTSDSPAPVKSSGRVHGRLANATEVQIAGQTVSACGDIFELGLNFAHYLQVRGRGFSPALYRKKVHPVALQLDNLLAQRKQAITQQGEITPALSRVQQQEGKMLQDLRDLIMLDYLEYHSATQRFWVLQNTAFLLDLARNEVGIAGNLIALDGNHLRRPRFAGSSGVCGAITGALVMLQPVVGRVTGNISGSAARRLVSKELTDINVRTSDVFALDRLKLVSAVQEASQSGQISSGFSQRLSLYAEQQDMMESMNSYFKNERRRARNTLVENVAYASLVGPPRIANGITSIVGGWRYFGDTVGKERLYLAGNEAYAAGTGVNILETFRVQASEELRQYRLGKKHMRTKQQLKDRLSRLNKLETSLK